MNSLSKKIKSKMGKRGQLNNPLTAFIGLSIALVIVVFIIVFGIVMLENLGDQVDNTSEDASNAVDDGKSELTGLMGWVGLVILVFVMVILIGAIMLIARQT